MYLCNAAACYIKKEMWQLAAEQCTQALKINDTYIKVGLPRSRKIQQQQFSLCVCVQGMHATQHTGEVSCKAPQAPPHTLCDACRP